MTKKEKAAESPHKREAYGLLIAFIGLFFILSLTSYHPSDGGWGIGNITGSIEIQNWFGQLGAFFAGPVFIYTFGYFSIGFFLYIFVGGIKFLLHRPFPAPRRWLSYIFIWAFWGSAIIAFIYRIEDTNNFYPSGMFGQIYVNSAYALLGEFGALFFSVVLILASIIITFRLSIILNLKTRRQEALEKKEMNAPILTDTNFPEHEEESIYLDEIPDKKPEPAAPERKEQKNDAAVISSKSEKKRSKEKEGKQDDLAMLKEELGLIGHNGKIDHEKDVDEDEWETFVKDVTSLDVDFAEKPKVKSKAAKKSIAEAKPEVEASKSKKGIPIDVNWDKIESGGKKPGRRPSTEEIHAEKERLEVEEAIKAKEVNIDKVKKRSSRTYKFPSMKLLSEPAQEQEVSQEELEMNAQILEAKLADFNIEAKVVKAYAGPVVTMFELKLAPGVKISRVTNLTQDLAMGMQARGIRIIAPIPGKSTVGIEIPNRNPQMVNLRSLINSKQFANSKAPLTIALGKTVNGDVYVADLAKMPHLLMAGTTGSGKSVGINTIIASLLYRANPDEVKFVMIDPKMLELSPYKALEQHHLSFSPDLDEKVVTKPENAVAILNSVVQEMENRYKLLSKSNVRKLDDYNEKLKKVGAENMPHPELNHKTLPYIIVIIDELADLMITASKDNSPLNSTFSLPMSGNSQPIL